MTLPMFPTGPAAPRAVTLVRLAGEIARSLAPVGRISVEGEVYKPRRVGTRIYFTLRDRVAQIAVSGPASRCRAVDGERVGVVGTLTWISERGQLQLMAEAATPVGAGAVAAMVAEARQRLGRDGLLDRPRRPLPRLPRAIGVICGSDAAVRKDIESVVAARFPGYPLRIVECLLSGPAASLAITDALVGLVGDAEVDVIVLARGGGDAAQLMPFSDEELCRAICRSPVPVVSAIGHEGDRPLCDEVADVRCATPLAAAAAVVPDRQALTAELAGWRAAAQLAFERRQDAAGRRLAAVDTGQAVRQGAGRAHARAEQAGARLRLLHPRGRVAESRARLGSLEWRRRVHERVARAEGRLTADRRQLDALSPQRVLERGYAVVRAADGTVVRRSPQVASGEVVEIQLAEGGLAARVERVHGS
jgi:exodeoxyribonuclease VII large subunit